MNRKIFLFLLVIPTLCGTAGSALADKDAPIAKVDGKPIYLSEVKRLIRRLDPVSQQRFDKNGEWRQGIIRNYVTQVALAKRAEDEKFTDDPEIVFDIEHARRTVLSDRLLEQRLGQIQVNKEDIQTYYEKNKERYQVPKSLKLSYLILKNGREAEETASKMQKGKAGDKSWKKIKGWVSETATALPGLESLPPERLNQIFRLNKGETSFPMEVGKQFYLFHVDDAMLPQDRPFEEIGRQVTLDYAGETKNKVLADYIQETMKQEKVEIY